MSSVESLQAILFPIVLEHISMNDSDLVDNHPLRSFVKMVEKQPEEAEEGAEGEGETEDSNTNTDKYAIDLSHCAKWATDDLVEKILRHIDEVNKQQQQQGDEQEGGQGEGEAKDASSGQGEGQGQGQTEQQINEDKEDGVDGGEQGNSGASSSSGAQEPRFNIVQLSFSGCFKLSNAITYLLSELDWELEMLNISFCAKITSNGLTDLIKSPNMCENLKEFYFNSPGGHVSSESLHELLQSLPKLTHFGLENNEWMTGREFDGAATSSLQSLDFKNCINFELSVFLRQDHENLGETLKSIDLRGCSKTDSSALKTLVEKCPGLTELHVSGNFQTKAHVLVEVAETCKDLKVLHISGFRDFNDHVLQSLATSLNRNIEKLTLFNCATLSDEAVDLLDSQQWKMKEVELDLTWSQGLSAEFEAGFVHTDEDADPWTKRKHGDNMVFIERLGRTKFE